MKRLLALDGGGLRGIIALQALKEVERLTGKRCKDIFDFMCGSSTGGIIVLALDAGLSAASIEQLYLDHAAAIFSRRILDEVETVHGLRGPKYQREGLEGMLVKAFGQNVGSPHTWVTAYDIAHADLVLLHSRSCVAMGLATSAAPTFFPPVALDNAVFVDGGVGANDPAMLAASTALWMSGSTPDELRVLSLGTGHYEPRFTHDTLANAGLVDWVPILVDTLMGASANGVEDSMYALFPHYLRLNCPLPAALAAMDNPEPEVLAGLAVAGQNMVASAEHELADWLAAR